MAAGDRDMDAGFVCDKCGNETGGNRYCDRCLTRDRTLLTTIQATINTLPDAHAFLLGFQTTAPFDPTSTSRSSDPNRLPFGLDTVYDDWFHHAAGAHTRPGITAVLAEWANAWADKNGDPAPATVFAYLDTHLVWATNNPGLSGYPDFATELRILHRTVTRLAGTAPEPTGSNCLTCDGPLAREWGPTGLNDHATCQRCRREYTHADHVFAVRHKLHTAPVERPDALVTEPEARRLYPNLAAGTIRTWIARDRADHLAYQVRVVDWTKHRRQLAVAGLDPDDAGPHPAPPIPRLPEAGRNPDGQALYRLADITARAEKTTMQTAMDDAQHATPPGRRVGGVA